jgi:hypothetical protein
MAWLPPSLARLAQRLGAQAVLRTCLARRAGHDGDGKADRRLRELMQFAGLGGCG